MSISDCQSEVRPKKRPRWRKWFFSLVPVLALLLCFEAAGWIVDAKTGIRTNLLQAYRLMETETQPALPQASLAWPADSIAIRFAATGDKAATPPPSKSGAIADPAIDLSQVLITPDRLAGYSPRTFVIGESAAFGYPYSHYETLTGLLEKRFTAKDGAIFNAAQPGLGSSDLVPIVDRILDRFEPQTLILFVGNNEWIRWTPTPSREMSPTRLAALRFLSNSRAIAVVEYLCLRNSILRQRHATGLLEFLPNKELTGRKYALAHPNDNQVFDPATWAATKKAYLDQFEANLTHMVRKAQERRVRVVLLNMPFNYKLSPAWKRAQPESFDPRFAQDVRQAIQAAKHHLDQREFEPALQVIDNALQKDPLPPILHYMKGECLEGLGRKAEAERSFAACRENMIGNLGSMVSINERTAAVARNTGATLIDIRRLFDDFEHRRGVFFNEELIHDDCHPTPLGHQLIADVVYWSAFSGGR